MIHMIQVFSGNEITVARPGEDLNGLYVFNSINGRLRKSNVFLYVSVVSKLTIPKGTERAIFNFC